MRLEVLILGKPDPKTLRKLLRNNDVIIAVAVIVNGDSNRHRIARLKQHYGLRTLITLHVDGVES